jgi:chromate transporter
VVAIVANATYSFGRTSLRDYTGTIIAITTSALFWANISPFVVITGAALAGLVILRTTSTASAHVQSPKGQSQGLKNTMIFLLVPLSGILVLLLTDVKLFNLAALMIRIDLFAFGGAFASLPLMLHEVVNVRGWMDSKTFMDGIALGQVTPGPIVITSTFVGYMTYGIAGALVATLSIFTPSFLMVIGLTPVMDRLKTSANFLSATKGILASFVGLLFFITIKFALAVPWDLMKVLVGIAAFGALFGKVDILYVILTTAGISLLIF